ncbi:MULTISPECIES: AAA family ATPase [unclassified Burkholderia]|uniref:AAA family ATPase n=1 Tax=unclassified Burkholderia TaxID=2613784 RepID=UPI001423F63A|nr:AAA family ATPase [Burkholderia sp. Tr-860]NIF61587.1 AAA family ATPase [Burkholderia sp. Cy-647]NIF94848.1 AAA family ATPase [Burkholderia sp. Ax-1720]
MIACINRLKQFGIFNDFNGTKIQKFGRYNLIYGWNGTGKSTLSNLFSCFELRALIPRFSAAEFLITLEDGSTITETTLPSSQLNIHVFNQHFIRENIDWDKSVKSILLIAKEKIDDLQKLEKLKSDLQLKRKSHGEKLGDIKKQRETLEKFLTSAAKKMKLGLQAIDTSDSYYLNYDRRKLSNFIQNNSDAIIKAESVLSDEKVIDLTNSAKPEQLPSITFASTAIEPDYFKKAAARIRDLLGTTAVNQAIQRLTDNPDIRDWIQTGLEIHKQHDSHSCEFCGSPFTQLRAETLAAHFSKEFTEFQSRLQNAATWIESQGAPGNQLPVTTGFYKEFSSDSEALQKEYISAAAKINQQIEGWREALKAKITDPAKTDIQISDVSDEDITKFNDILKSIVNLVGKHNNKTSNFKAETSKSKVALELHFAAAEVQEFDYAGSEKKCNDLEEEAKGEYKEIEKLVQEVGAIEAQLSNETIGAKEFNDTLHRFIGRSELCLSFNQKKKGYEIIRNGVGEHDGNLSEGEKTAIAFVYFITKLRENGNNINDTIVVVDDPVSSFDSNHLFHAYSFLRNQCTEAKQLFVMTHNFTYFKLVRDWFTGTNKNRLAKGKPENCFFYRLDAPPGSPRHSLLVDADDSLKNYGSEYHYIFKKLYEYRAHTTLNRDEAFLTANLARKLIESFFTFKYPRRRSDISQLMDVGLKDCTITTPELKEKIYRFINKYSHSDVIEITEESAENLAGESHSVIGNIFQWMEEVDKKHYDEMVQVAAA